MYGIPFEDEYWEQVRERCDATFFKQPGEEDEVEEDSVFLDEEYQDLEKEFGKPMARFTEGELCDVLARFVKKGLEIISAEWNELSCGIHYTYSAT